MSRTGQLDPITGAPEDRRRITFVEDWMQLPLLNGSVVAGTPGAPSAAELALRWRGNRDFEMLGTNAVDTVAAFADGGGATFTTTTADADQIIVLPHLDTKQSAWAAAKWNTNDEPAFGVRIKTGASIANAIIWTGLKLTNTATTATDANQVFIRYEDDVNGGNWQLVSSNDGTDKATDSGVTVAASTEYLLQFKVDADRIVTFFINGVAVGTHTTGLKADIDLIPYIGVEVDGGTGAKAITVRPGYTVSKLLND
jgi:hypothetical protein